MGVCIACGQHTVSSFRFLCVVCQQFVDVKCTDNRQVKVVLKNAMTAEELMRPLSSNLSVAAPSETSPAETMSPESTINPSEVKL